MRRALAAYQRDDLAAAHRLCRAALTADPDHFEALHLLAVVMTRLGQFEDALAAYDRALALRPDDVQALSNRGALLEDLRRYAESLAS